MKSSRNSLMKRGTGIYECEVCGRKTRDTGAQSLGSKLCPDCWEIAGIYNVYQDEGVEGLAPYAADIRWHAGNIVAKGGKLDGDAKELLEIIGESHEG